MLTTFDADAYILTALHCGAAGFLLKDTEPEQLAQLVRTLAAGGVVLSPKASRTLLHSHPGTGAAVDEEAARVRLLTARERDVLALVAEGLSNADIGARFRLGAGTVKDHITQWEEAEPVNVIGEGLLLFARQMRAPGGLPGLPRFADTAVARSRSTVVSGPRDHAIRNRLLARRCRSDWRRAIARRP